MKKMIAIGIMVISFMLNISQTYALVSKELSNVVIAENGNKNDFSKGEFMVNPGLELLKGGVK